MGIENNLSGLAQERISFGEKCGVVGVFDRNNGAPSIARQALTALQHRGQEAAGISTFLSNEVIATHHGFGLVVNAIPHNALDSLGGATMAIAHNRYSTVDRGREDNINIQPIHLRQGAFEISLGHNGNLFNLNPLIQTNKLPIDNASDSYALTAYLLDQRTNYDSWKDTLLATLPELKNTGAFSLVILTDGGHMYGVRDTYGIRPLVLGQLDEGWVMTSETVALDLVHARYLREIKRGEIVEVNHDGKINFYPFGQPQGHKPCALEKIYFSHPASYADGQRISVGRINSGRALAKRMKEKGLEVDSIVPVLDSGMFAAVGVAKELGKPYNPTVTADHYVGRTFILPGEGERRKSVNGKFNFIPETLADQDILAIDDSVVRRNTMDRFVQGAKDAGARNVDFGSSSPPVVDECDIGVDMKNKELQAAQWREEPLEVIEENMAKATNARSLTFLPIEPLASAFGGKKPEHVCHYCFGGPHPIRGPQEDFRQKERQIVGKPKISVFISGSGTNLQKMIDGVESGDINGQITSVVSNNPEAYGLQRAEKHGLPYAILPSRGKLRDPNLRTQYEAELIKMTEQIMPDVIVLAGWMVVLGDAFLERMQTLEIPVLNLHPALLTEGNETTVNTSRGQIPVIRGTHAIEEAYAGDLSVSGVTVHQVLPGNLYDVGPIILQEEVRRINGETFEQWEKRIHEAEYRTLPAALKRVLHVMKHNIDVSKGDFPW